MAALTRSSSVVVALAVLAGCGGDTELTAEDIAMLYVADADESPDDDESFVASESLRAVTDIHREGNCTTANAVSGGGHDVTVVIRDREVVDVVTGHLAHEVDADSERCWSRDSDN